MESLYNNAEYLGWIPCLSGKLNFAYAKSGLSGKKQQECNIPLGESGDRLIVISSDINWKDRVDKAADGNFSVIATVKEYSPEGISGDVYLYPTNARTTSQYFISKNLNKLYDLRTEYVEALHSKIIRGESEELVQRVEKLKTALINKHIELRDYLDLSMYVEPEFYQVKFTITECGLTFLNYENPYHQRVRGNEFEDVDSEETKASALRQAFYFLKYAIHEHKHHKEEDDAVATIIKASPPFHEVGRKLVELFLNALVDLRRNNTRNKDWKYSEHEGFISYIKSLITTCKSAGMLNKRESKKMNGRIDGISASINTSSEKHREKSADKGTAQQYARTFSTLCLAIISLSILSLFRVYSPDAITNPVDFCSNSTVCEGVRLTSTEGTPSLAISTAKNSFSDYGYAVYDTVYSNVEVSVFLLILLLGALYFLAYNYYTDFKFLPKARVIFRVFYQGDATKLLSKGNLVMVVLLLLSIILLLLALLLGAITLVSLGVISDDIFFYHWWDQSVNYYLSLVNE
jgi:hypothetical protein